MACSSAGVHRSRRKARIPPAVRSVSIAVHEVALGQRFLRGQ